MKTLHLLGAALLGLALLGLVAGRGLGGVATTGAADPPRGTWSCGVMSGDWGDWGSMWGDPDRMGPGMMGDRGMTDDRGTMGGMWGTMGSMGMMASYAATAMPIAEADARQHLATFAAGCGPDVQVADVVAFGSTYYAQLVDGSGTGLLEVLVDRYTGAVSPEPGPNMVWNSRWGMHAGTGGAARHDQAAAHDLAATFLATYLPGATVLAGQAFPGYYTFAFGRGQVEAMLSVNAATGEVWVHTWHGPALPEVA